MRNLRNIILIAGILLMSLNLQAQLTNLRVERYYLADTNDQTDTSGGNRLQAGTITYRIFLEMKPGYLLKSVFGNSHHRLFIDAGDTIFNNLDRPNACFGYQINKSWFSSNPTIALDSWLTLGMATKAHMGILKIDDPDGSFIGGQNNGGGSAAIPGGLLVNADTTCGVPFTYADGLIPATQTLGQWVDVGFKNLNNEDTTVFGPFFKGRIFESWDAMLQQSSGVSGYDSTNSILIAQISTRGELRFELNVVVMDTNNNETILVANNPLENEKISAFLTYPLPCGCRDPHYLEYNALYGCDHPDSCKTIIHMGCMDVNACNYDPQANFNVPDLCCYPGWCQDRDLSVVCPDLVKTSIGSAQLQPHFFPNPVEDVLTVELSCSDLRIKPFEIQLLDPIGDILFFQSFSEQLCPFSFDLNMKNYARGWYILRLISEEGEIHAKIIRN